VTDAEKVSYASHSFLSFFNVASIKELGEKFSSILDIVQNSENFINKENILKSFSKGVSLYDFIHNIDETHRVISLVDGDSVEKSFLVNISKITQTKFLINLTDVTKMQKEKEDTTKKAYTDSLTGIANRNKFEEVFLYELQRVQRYQEAFTIALMDIDHFKLVNDNFGHLIGDEILVCITNITQKSVRGSDLFARWGGEEFVILFNKTDLENATLSAEHIRKLIQNTHHNLVGEITVSFGLTEYKDGDTIESMLARADEALYKAKASGRNCVRSVK
jgi:diguanylate cyclase (GGDEF)-like protein